MSAFDELIAANPQMLAKNNKYAPKLSFTDRCAILAAYKAGVLKQILAEAFGINVSTVEYICSPSSSHYRAVRRELADLGPDRFHKEYLTDEQAVRIGKAKDSLEKRGGMETQKQHDARVAVERLKVHGPDKRAAGMAGRKTVRIREGTLWVEVVWAVPTAALGYEGDRPEGWYVTVDAASPAYYEGLTGHFGLAIDANTSKSCWRGFLSATQAEEMS